MYPEELTDFGRLLTAFPSRAQDEIRFELGSLTEKWACYVLLRAYLFDAVGHAALEIHIDNRDSSPRCARANFSICCEVAALNRLGSDLQRWVLGPANPLFWTPIER